MIKKIISVILLTTPIWFYAMLKFVEHVCRYGLIYTLLLWCIIFSIMFLFPYLGMKMLLRCDEESKKDVYVVTAKTQNGCHGTEIKLFGVFDNVDVAEVCARKVTKDNEIPSCKITRVKLNKYMAKYLGGYVE